MSQREISDQYLDLFLNDTPMMDVRAPVEFNQGAFPNTQNIPLLDDEQRAVIGRQYKDAGQDEAIELGLKLATPEIRAQRLTDWKAFVEKHPDGYLYCFRGGLRSRTTQAWLKEQGIDYPLVVGGYKAMRRFLIEQLALSVQQIPFVILSGLTGSGKTRVLQKTPWHIDLEGLANHRGSAFGRNVDDFQPTPINFENALSISALKYRHQNPQSGVLLEDEGKLIGRLIIPQDFHNKMVESPRIFLERTTAERVQIIREDYISANWPLYQQRHGEQAEDRFSEFVLDNLTRIRKRLGGERFQQIQRIFSVALQKLFDEGDSQYFDAGIQSLLVDYYDPMYRYQLQKKPVEVVFRGDESEILDWAEQHLKKYSGAIKGIEASVGFG